MKRHEVLNKKVGETPLAAIERFRETEGVGEGVALAYAGRLDPMAEGKLLVLIGDECKKQKQYHGLDKEYEFEILLDVESDSGDVLGLASIERGVTTPGKGVVLKTTKSLVGNVSLPYPVFSSKTVGGKPLFLWQLEGRIDEIEIPVQHSRIYKLSFLDQRTISADELRTYIFEKIEKIPAVVEESKRLGADFRRAEIRTRWQSELKKVDERPFTILKFRTICSSGTYIRSLAPALARELGTSGLALSIKRTKIGTFQSLLGSLGFWQRQY